MPFSAHQAKEPPHHATALFTITLTARGEEYDKLFGFEVGADDYVTKPFSPKELMARVNVIIRRHQVTAINKEEKMVFGGLEIDTLGHVLYVNGGKVELTAKDYSVLLYLAENKRIVLSREKILGEVWGYQKELLANVSHDLRTPLTMIRGYAEMVRDISWSDDNQREADIAVILDETDRLNALVNEILEYSKLAEKGGADEMFTEVDFGALAKSVADRFEPLFSHDGGVIERNIEEGCIVNGNEQMLERVVYNLIDNAIRHSGEAKKISVRVISGKSVIDMGAGPVIFEVRDYGEGIDESELPHIWEKYYTSRMRDGKGVSGLGLAIVKQITEIHGGTCIAMNAPEGGSIFRIELP